MILGITGSCMELKTKGGSVTSSSSTIPVYSTYGSFQSNWYYVELTNIGFTPQGGWFLTGGDCTCFGTGGFNQVGYGGYYNFSNNISCSMNSSKIKVPVLSRSDTYFYTVFGYSS